MRADQGQGNTLPTKLQLKWEDILDANNCQRTSQLIGGGTTGRIKSQFLVPVFRFTFLNNMKCILTIFIKSLLS